MNGKVFFDADCAMCVRWAKRFRFILGRRGFALVPLQAPETRRVLSVGPGELLKEMRVLTPDGRMYGGADAVVYLARIVPFGWLLRALSRLPGAMPLLRRVYGCIARNRDCDRGACRRTDRKFTDRAVHWLPLFLLTATALIYGSHLPAWAYMWTLCFAMFFGCKWITFWNARDGGVDPTVRNALHYFLAWPGMDATAFLSKAAPETRSPEAWFAVTRILFGLILVWGIARRFLDPTPLIAGWIGMIGLILLLHFGLFDLLSFFWRRRGVNAVPLMRAPILSSSVGEFWGRRWNTAFNRLVFDLLFRPVSRMAGARGATLVVFVVSGFIHELAISVPARAGYGFPTLYFLIQGGALLLERTEIARQWKLDRGPRGWLFTLLVTAGPAFWLFHPPFVLNVMLPFFKAIHAI